MFCSGEGEHAPDVINLSRWQKSSELAKCIESGVEGVVEVKIGFDSIVLTNAVDAPLLALDLRDLYLAFARQVPVGDNV